MAGKKQILAVDLDGSLIRSDLLHESFWSALGGNVFALFGAILALCRGIPSLKKYFYQQSQVDVATLPYDDDVIAYVKAWRKRGGYTILITAAHHQFAEEVSAHLQIFDDVKGSAEGVNMKGQEKSDYLTRRFGQGNFAYIGDARADLGVWKNASRAIAVRASSGLLKKIERLGVPHEIIGLNNTFWPNVWPSVFRALRPHQWLKNLLVFLPMLASHQINLAHIQDSLVAFAVFSLFASGVYVLNDLLDLTADRAHPRKRLRVFASGGLPVNYGGVMLLGLLGVASALAAIQSFNVLILMLVYVVLNLGYSLKIKTIIGVDILVLSGLYCLRIVVGGAATDIEISSWLILFASFFFLALAAVKRQAELVDLKNRGLSKVLGRGYEVSHLPIIKGVGLGAGIAALVVMVLYIHSSQVLTLYKTPWVLLAVCGILAYWLRRLIAIAQRGGMTDDPIIFSVKDKMSYLCLIFIVMAILIGATL